MILGGLCLTLAACSVQPQRAAPAQVEPDHDREPNLATAPSETPSDSSQPNEASAIPPVPEPLSLWDRLRQRYALPGCDYRPEVLRWARNYTRSPSAFSATLARAMPFLLVVADGIENRQLPGEFAMLPFLESSYRPFPSQGDRPAGIWQLIPDTAREAGVRISRDYDGRLDIYTSTSAALDLLQRYGRAFDDWRLADMAFNAGEYRIRKLAAQRPAELSAEALARWRLSPTTHEHLAKLLALACVIGEPQRFGVTLPSPAAEDAVRLIEFESAIDLRLASRLARIDEAKLRSLNPGLLRARMPEHGPYHLLLPQARVDDLQKGLRQIPPDRWRAWRWITLKQTESVSVVADANFLEPAWLAAINDVAADGQFVRGARILVPGVTIDTSSTKENDVHVVRSGDSLWEIARQHQLSVGDLSRWNRIPTDTTLQPGQRLRLNPPVASLDATSTGPSG